MKSILATLLVTFAISAGAQVSPQVIADLKAKYPNTQFREVNATPIPNIYEVVMGQNVAYVEASGRYFFFGRLFDMQQQQDLTEAKVAHASAIDVRSLPVQDAMKPVKGNGKRALYVFLIPTARIAGSSKRNLVDVRT
jgi:thiol:disulfide interchange protein DsbC